MSIDNWLAFGTLAAAVLAAGSAHAGGPGGIPGPESQAEATAPIDWRPCALTEDDTERQAECALVYLPLRHDDPDGDMIGIAVKRVLAANAEGPRRQLWYLSGGPGDSGIDALPRVRSLFARIDQTLDLYTLDHRGVGGSALLSCPQQEAPDSPEGRDVASEEWADCVQSILAARSDLDALTATAAAHDTARLIDATRAPGDQAFIFGASYGSYWANRYLQLYADQPDAVILDGVVPGDWTFAEFDAGLDRTGRRLMELCGEQPECAARLGDDPAAVAAALPGRFDEGHCPDLQIDGRTVRLLLGNMLMGGEPLVTYIPAMVYRLDRCRLRDLLAIGALFERTFESGEAGVEPESHSPVLQRHVALSEIWPEPPPSVADLEAAAATAAMTTEVSASFARTREDWPVYPRPELAGGSADYRGPLLMLHGGLDPTMPPERLAGLRAHYGAENQTFVLFPTRGHVVVTDSECAEGLYGAFLADPRATLETDCAAAEPALDVTGGADAQRLFGTGDYWGTRPSNLEFGIGGAIVAILALLTALIVRFVRRRRARRAAA